jgi:hypothetical protein
VPYWRKDSQHAFLGILVFNRFNFTRNLFSFFSCLIQWGNSWTLGKSLSVWFRAWVSLYVYCPHRLVARLVVQYLWQFTTSTNSFVSFHMSRNLSKLNTLKLEQTIRSGRGSSMSFRLTRCPSWHAVFEVEIPTHQWNAKLCSRRRRRLCRHELRRNSQCCIRISACRFHWWIPSFESDWLTLMLMRHVRTSVGNGLVRVANPC